MASATRSKRAEGVNPHTRPLTATITRAARNHTPVVHQFPLAKSKRRRDDSEHVPDAKSPKKARLTINLSSSPKPQHRTTPAVVAPTSPHQSRTGPRAAAAPASKPPPPPKPQPPSSHTRQHRPPAPAPVPAPSAPSAAPQPPQRQQPPQHQQSSQQLPQSRRQQPQSRISKTSNVVTANDEAKPSVPVAGREVGKLQPGPAAAADTKPSEGSKAPEGRKLRSQEATRFKSDLSAYFPDYDEVIGNDKKPEYALERDTPILLVDPVTVSPVLAHQQPSTLHSLHPSGGQSEHGAGTIRSYGDNLFTDLFDSHEISFAFLEGRNNSKGEDDADPLPDSYFEPTHKKAERAERSIRNSERGRAQHEKEQIIRLLDGLQGHDWLRTMGVSGITESRKKEFEAPRQHFIKGCEAILEKFRRWNQEEKRRKLEKERAMAEATRLENGEDSDGSEEGQEEEEQEEQEDPDDEMDGDNEDDQDEEVRGNRGSRGINDSDEEPPSDVDASIAKQLREEAMARSRVVAKKAPTRSRRAPPAQPAPPPEPPAPRCFTSFFEKKYQRDAALSKNRRKGRTVLAWGQMIPDFPPQHFELPAEFLDEKTLRSNERRKRRDRRGSK